MAVSRPGASNRWLWIKLTIVAASLLISGWRLFAPAGPVDAPKGGEMAVDLRPDNPLNSDE